MPTNLVIIACSIFRYELEHMQETGKLNLPVVYLNSMLHMYPKELQVLLDAKLKEYENFKIILLYGDCHAGMVDYEKKANIRRTPGINLCEIILGNEDYRKKRKKGAFILLPEWAERWKEAFVDYMGFKTSEAIKPFMSEMHKKISYIDTGFHKKDQRLMHEISDFIGLPLEIYPCSMNELEKTLEQLIIDFESTEKPDYGK